MRAFLLSVIVAGWLSGVPAVSHELPSPADVGRVKGVGHCAKGPCQKRANFGATVPHRHLGGGKCVGGGAAGYRFVGRFACPGQ